MQSLNTREPLPHIENIKQAMQDLARHLREDIEKVPKPRAQALFETSAKVLYALIKAFDDYKAGSETAWRR